MTTDYTYGDGKYSDAANFGLFKQNWGMLRVCASRYGFVGQSEGQWNNGALLKYVVLFLTRPSYWKRVQT
jgi:hypothetical protein